MKKTIIGLTALVTTSLSLGLWAHETHADGKMEQAIEYRQAVMNVVGWNFKHMAGMVKGKVPFDEKAFAAHAAELQQVSKFNFLSGFPEDSDDSEETDAKPDIWMDWEDFQSKYKDFQSAASQLAAASGQEAMKKQFGATGKTCKACHKAYKN